MAPSKRIVTRQSRSSEALVTLYGWKNKQRAMQTRRKGQYAMATHSPIDHLVSKPCIFFWKVTQRETIPVIVIESIHHALQNVGEKLDEAWETFHSTYPEVKEMFNLSSGI